MELTFLRISCVLLIIACFILAVDKSATGYKLHNVASRVAEKTEIIEENEKRFKKEISTMQSVANERERRMYFRTSEDYSEKTALFPAEQKLLPRSPEEKLAKQLLKQIQTDVPEQLIRDVVKADDVENDRKKISVAKYCVIHPETGVITYPPAAVLEEVARKNGMTANTSFVWDMKNFRLGCVTTVIPPKKSTNRHAAHHDWTSPVTINVIQNSKGNVVFPFSATDTHKEREITFLPVKSGVPLGGLYVHYYRLTGRHGFQLDYELPAHAADEDFQAGIKLFPLVCGSASTVQHGKMRSFRIEPVKGEMAFLIVAERAFFPVSVTGMTLYRETPVAAAASSSVSPRPERPVK